MLSRIARYLSILLNYCSESEHLTMAEKLYWVIKLSGSTLSQMDPVLSNTHNNLQRTATILVQNYLKSR